MRLLIVFLMGTMVSCFSIEEMDNIPQPGIYISTDAQSGYNKKLSIKTADKGYDISFVEEAKGGSQVSCSIIATGKKSSYGIWVELPLFGPRLPVIIRKVEDTIVISLKRPDDPKDVFKFCESDRSPAGIYILAN